MTSSREDTGRDNIETCTNTKAFYHIWKPIINWQILKIISAEPTADFSGNNSRGAPVSNSCKLSRKQKSFLNSDLGCGLRLPLQRLCWQDALYRSSSGAFAVRAIERYCTFWATFVFLHFAHYATFVCCILAFCTNCNFCILYSCILHYLLCYALCTCWHYINIMYDECVHVCMILIIL